MMGKQRMKWEIYVMIIQMNKQVMHNHFHGILIHDDRWYKCNDNQMEFMKQKESMKQPWHHKTTM